MRHFFTTKVKVILVVALLLAVGLSVISNVTGKDIPGQLVQGILSPIRAGAKALTNQAEQIYRTAHKLFEENAPTKPVRLIGVSTGNLTDRGYEQLSFADLTQTTDQKE